MAMRRLCELALIAAVAAEGSNFTCTDCKGVFQARMLCCTEHEKDGCEYNNRDNACEPKRPMAKEGDSCCRTDVSANPCLDHIDPESHTTQCAPGLVCDTSAGGSKFMPGTCKKALEVTTSGTGNSISTCTPPGGRCHGNQPDTCCDYSECVVTDELAICSSTLDHCMKKDSPCTINDKRTSYCCPDIFLDSATTAPYKLVCESHAGNPNFNGACAPSTKGLPSMQTVAIDAADVKVGKDFHKIVTVKKEEQFIVSLVGQAGWKWEAETTVIDDFSIVDQAQKHNGKETTYVFDVKAGDYCLLLATFHCKIHFQYSNGGSYEDSAHVYIDMNFTSESSAASVSIVV